MKQKLLVIAHTNLGNSLSGGDQIFLNLIKNWQQHFQICLLASPEAIRLQKLFSNSNICTLTTCTPSPIRTLSTLNLFLHHFFRFYNGLKFSLNNFNLFRKYDYIYTSSDFYGDIIFGLVAKISNPRIHWICGYYLLAPNPLNPHSPYNTLNHPFRGLIYYLAQIPTKFIANCFANTMFVTSQPDIAYFKNKQTFIIQGGVYIPTSTQISKMSPVQKRKYDVLYIGRLHTQKGILEFIKIWRLVVNKLPFSQLAIIGDGELAPKISSEIINQKLTKNVSLLGFKNGQSKFKIIKNSKIIVHPATYDSGGMAAAEAMAWGLPGVSYDLPALKTYYPDGMVKTKCFNQVDFANNILRLLNDSHFYQTVSDKARNLIINNWSWEQRFSKIYQILTPVKTSR